MMPRQLTLFEGDKQPVGRGASNQPLPDGLRYSEGFLSPAEEQRLAKQLGGLAFADLEPAALEHALLTEYPPGAGIGWHRDRSVFGDTIGISLLAPARLRFRRHREEGWQRTALVAEPGSIYLLRGAARSEWEHSIPAVDRLRYSITFRTLA
jgi:alkylated DNA repair dioxygenase AlkB